jgi:uncharacterized membrane protein YbhN (UPF0104 family)
MSAIPALPLKPGRRRWSPRRRRPGAPRRFPTVNRRQVTLLLLLVLAVSLLASVPGLRDVRDRIGHLNPAWIIVAVGLEVASGVSFMVLFRLFFDRLPDRDARRLAWVEQAAGVLLPGGGAGGLAIGGWLAHLAGAPTRWIIRRSGGIFFLTSAVNSASLIAAGVALTVGVPGRHGFAPDVLPAVLAAAATLPVAALPLFTRSRRRAPAWIRAISAGVEDAEQTTFTRHPSWRLTGALGYLGFDMAVLWVTLRALGHAPSIPSLVLAYNIGYLANALPIPGGVGVLDAGLTGALVLYGVSPAHAAAAVIVYHAIALWIPGLGGLWAYLLLRPRLLQARHRDQLRSTKRTPALTEIRDEGIGTDA